MRVVIQRVTRAKVTTKSGVVGEIERGLLILAGIDADDTPEDLEWITRKILGLRIFADEAGNMNESVSKIGGELLVVSQFTLHASTKKGNRPSFIKAAKPQLAEEMYDSFVKMLAASGLKVATGEFGADMNVESVNKGPVTIIMDSKNKE